MNLTGAQTPLSDPSGSDALGSAALWVQHAMLGTIATVVAIIAVAVFGFAALSGRLDLRRGAIIVLGCFVIFGAPAIASAFMRFGQDIAQPPPAPPLMVINKAPVALAAPPAKYDPYAGASVPLR